MRGDFVIAHTHRPAFRERDRVSVFRVFRRASLRTALKAAAQIRRHGYLVWIESADRIATQ